MNRITVAILAFAAGFFGGAAVESWTIAKQLHSLNQRLSAVVSEPSIQSNEPYMVFGTQVHGMSEIPRPASEVNPHPVGPYNTEFSNSTMDPISSTCLAVERGVVCPKGETCDCITGKPIQ